MLIYRQCVIFKCIVNIFRFLISRSLTIIFSDQHNIVTYFAKVNLKEIVHSLMKIC